MHELGQEGVVQTSTEYLKRYGYVPRTSPNKKPHLSPLERLMAGAGITKDQDDDR